MRKTKKDRRKINSPGPQLPYPFRILVMCEAELEPATRQELEKIPGSVVYVCSSSIELLLYLEHQRFELVMVFWEQNPSPDFLAATDFLAAECRGVPVLVTKQPTPNLGVWA